MTAGQRYVQFRRFGTESAAAVRQKLDGREMPAWAIGILVALLAWFIPARRATRLEPLTALPHD